jgi:hypothetical protein
MATSKCTINKIHYWSNGYWSAVFSDISKAGGYASNYYKRYVALEFKTPTFTTNEGPYKLSFNLPFLRDDNTGQGSSTRDASGVFYAKVFTAIPSGGWPSASDNDVSANWYCYNSNGYKDMEVHVLTKSKDDSTKKNAGITATGNLKGGFKLESNKTYYLVIASSNTIQVGWSQENTNSKFEIKFATFTNGAAPTITTFEDLVNNKFRLVCKAPANATNNNLRSTKIEYVCKDKNGNTVGTAFSNAYSESSDTSYANTPINPGTVSDSSGSKVINVPENCTEVAVTVTSTFTYGTTTAKRTTTASSTKPVLWHDHMETTVGGSSAPRVSIQDHGNNTFSISGTGCGDSTENTVTTTYFWGYGNYDNSGPVSEQSLPAGSDTASAEIDVQAKIMSVPSWSYDTNYNDGAGLVATKTVGIKQYIKPSEVTKAPEIKYTKGRLTLKESWNFIWGPADQANDSSPVKGYHIKLQKKKVDGTYAELPIYNSSKDVTEGNGFYDRTNNTVESSGDYSGYIKMPFHTQYNLECLNVGDIVRFGVAAYTKNKSGKGDKLVAEESYSSDYTICNAGVVNVKADSGAPKEGQVWVKVANASGSDNGWREAEIVLVKVANTGNQDTDWKESE